ncbi:MULTISPECIES: hypothetical protein [Cyanophyceae]|uniref:hypothetical protein n=1 Tax=Cyanophyceae TaxID=3028117 RepID=UPI00168681E1|nr:hypothetical protein [Trichocoleus sp. FACHB-69]MBD1930367.1 hypothetical protein [Trichocoleus sp. FACHB-69]
MFKNCCPYDCRNRERSHGKIAAETAASIRTSRRLTLNFKPLLKDEPFLIQSRTIYSQVPDVLS